MSGKLTSGPVKGRVGALITFWSHALAAMLFVSLLLWRLGDMPRAAGPAPLAGGIRRDRLLGLARGDHSGDPLVGFAESARNLVWIGLLYSF